MELLLDPAAWAGFVTLVVLELVLGIDNLVFIAILVDKLPQKQRDQARRLGLFLALAMRIGMLAGISWLASFTAPLLQAPGFVFSARDLILIGGGAFLLCKATTEVHHRVEGLSRSPKGKLKAQFWMVVAQIVILDAVFSLDAVIMAIGMTDHLAIMVGAVTVAIFIMVTVSKRLTAFVNKHPTVVMLCLGFLLMVGLSLILDGFGIHIPKGYLYAAIAFSIMIEAINQIALVKMKKRVSNSDVRERAADAILKLMGAKPLEDAEEAREANVVLQEAAQVGALAPAEKEMMRAVLNLSERPVHTIMTPRIDVEYIDITLPYDELLDKMMRYSRSHILAVDGAVDNVMGTLRRDDLMMAALEKTTPSISRLLREPLFVQRSVPVIDMLEIFKKKPVDLAVVVDEAGSMAGVVTRLDLLEAIAGEFPDHEDEKPLISEEEGALVIDGMSSIYDLRSRLGVDYEPDGRFSTVAGLMLHELGHMPEKGAILDWSGWKLEVIEMQGRRISKIRAERLPFQA
jgi:CBS domain containing-hemolysin-like protein